LCFEVDLVAVERPDGLLVDRLLEAGVRVLALHPNQVKAARDRFRASGGKSDRFDRFVLCELARTDAHRFRILEPDSDQTKALRALTRAREDLVKARVAMSNQLRAELERFWPAPIGLFSDLTSPISLAFLERYPSATDARRLGEKRLAAFLRANHYNNRTTAAQLLERLRQAPTVDIDEPLREEIGKLLPLTRARDAPIGAEHKAGDAGQVEILPEQLSEVGGLSVYRQVGAVDHRQRLLTERADERGRRILGRRWTRRPGQAGNHRDGDDKAPAVSGTAATRSSANELHHRHTPCCRALPIGPLLRPNEIVLVTLE